MSLSRSSLSLSLNLATQARLRALAETHHRLLHVSAPRLVTSLQRTSHARLLEGLEISWTRLLLAWSDSRPSA